MRSHKNRGGKQSRPDSLFSKEAFATNGCSSGKRAWAVRSAAKAKARDVKQRGGDHTTPYRCEECGMYHLGHLAQDVAIGNVDRSVMRSTADVNARHAAERRGTWY